MAVKLGDSGPVSFDDDKMNAHSISRVVLAVFYAAAGILHLAVPAPFVSIVPGWVPAPATVVMLTGVAEIAGAVGIAQGWFPGLRVAAAWGLALYAVCVWPANVQHMLLDWPKPGHGLGLGYHGPRLALQPVIVWWPLWAVNGVAWPFRAP